MSELSTVDPAHSDPQASPTVLSVALLAGVVVLSVLLLEALYHDTAHAEQGRKLAGEGTRVQALRTEQRKMLEGYRWVDAEAGVVAMPIERAMDLVVQESSGGRDPQGE